MDNNNGRGIFYGVIGVATLIVAIIGATFAYFSANITGVNNVQAGSANITLQWGTEVTDGIRTDLIPIDTDGANVGKGGTTDANDTTDYEAAFAEVIGVGDDDCEDTTGNSICSVYQFEIVNPSTTTAQTVYGHIAAATNTYTDLYYAVFVGDAATLKSKGKFTVHGTESNAETIMAGTDQVGLIHKAALTSDLASYVANSTDSNDWTKLTNATKLLQADGQGTNSITYTIVLWLEESYTPQDTQEGLTFSASVMFNTGSGTGVTGKLEA